MERDLFNILPILQPYRARGESVGVVDGSRLNG
jgi:hypothetical protein